MDGRKCHCFLQAQMKLLYAQSNLEHVLDAPYELLHIPYNYHDNGKLFYMNSDPYLYIPL